MISVKDAEITAQPPVDNIETVAHLDESDLLALIFPQLPSNSDVLVGPGDDCAQVSATSGSFVVSTDILIENVHFKPEWSTGYQVGWRAATQNLADIAAMGARPTSLVVGLAMPKTTAVEWVVEFARGLGDAARSVGAAVVGGDLSSAPSLFISVTVHGDCGTTAPVLRSGARPDDIVALAGHTGWSAAGFELLLAQDGGKAGSNSHERTLAVQSFLAPTSPISLGVAAADNGATAMMDVSDGLLRDAQRICKASGVSIILDYTAITRNMPGPTNNPALSGQAPEFSVHNSTEGLLKLAGEFDETAQQKVAQWLLTGGEDHALLATFPAGTHLPNGFFAIGTVGVDDQITEPKTQQPVTQRGAVRVVGVDMGGKSTGWDHFL